MKSHILSCIAIIIMLVSITTSISAQNGGVKGIVYDKNDKSPLPGAVIYPKENSSSGTVTDLDGRYAINGLSEGEIILVVSYLSYETQEIPVTIEGGVVKVIDVDLFPEGIVGEEIIVTAQAMGQNKAINQQLNSDAIGNFIAVEKIKELPDVNAAEAISRLPGVAINRSGGEGSKIVVRGLDPKFTAISVNGVRLPSTSGDDRSVDLALISPELLSGIELFKSPTPDMDGDALGGSVNLNIVRAPKDRKISIKGLNGYNVLGNTLTDYKGTVSFSDRFINDKIGLIATANVERFNRGGETINQSWQDNQKVVLDTLLDIFAQEGTALQYQKRQESRKRQNGSLGIDYQLGDRSEFNLLGIYSKTSRDRYNNVERYDVLSNRVRFTPNIIENNITLFSGSLTAQHRLDFVKIDWGASYSTVAGDTPIDYEPMFTNDRAPFDTEVFKQRTRPSSFYDFVNLDYSYNYLLETNLTESSNSERIASSFINFDVPVLKRDATKVNFKFGGKLLTSNKERALLAKRARTLYLLPNSHFAAFTPGQEPLGALGVDPTGRAYYSMDNFTTDETLTIQQRDGDVVNMFSAFDKDKIKRFKDLFEKDMVENRYQATNNYDLTETVSAFYGMFKINLGNKLTVIPGARYEYSNNTYSGKYSDLSGDFGESGNVKDVTEDVQYGVFLPHLHLKYKPIDWFDLRASYSTTLARPDFEYLIPFTLVNRSSDLVITQGNPNLRPSVSTNIDLFATAYSGKYGILTAGVFNKKIKDAFYPLIVGLNSDSIAVDYGFPATGFVGGVLTTYTNSPESNVRGFEFDLQSNLSFLPGLFKGFVLNLNYTRLFSNTTINSFYEETVFSGIPPIIIRTVQVFPYQREVDLIGQAKHIFNASLGYDYKGFSIRTSAAFQGSKLTGYSGNADKDRFDREFWRMDMVLKQKFGYNFNVFLNLNNLTDQNDVSYFRTPDLETSRSRFGTTVTLGAEYIFR